MTFFARYRANGGWESYAILDFSIFIAQIALNWAIYFSSIDELNYGWFILFSLHAVIRHC